MYFTYFFKIMSSSIECKLYKSESESHSVVFHSWWLHGILQARILEWVAFPFSSDLPNPGIELRSPILWADSLPAEPPGKPRNTGVVAYPFSSGSSWPRNQTGVSCIAGRFFTNWAIREALKASIFTAFLNPQFLKQCMASRQTW